MDNDTIYQSRYITPDNPELFEIHTFLTFDEYRKYNAELTKQKRPVRMILDLIVVAASVYCMIVAGIFYGIGFLVFWTLYRLVILKLIWKRSEVKMYDSLVSKDMECIYRFTENGFEASSPNSIIWTEYGRIKKIMENDTTIYLMTGDRIGHIISKAGMIGEQLDFIKRKCSNQ